VSSMVDCPDEMIPDVVAKSTTTTTRLPPTGRPGDIGATGGTVRVESCLVCFIA